MGQFTVPEDTGLRILGRQRLQQLIEGMLLRLGPRIDRNTPLIQSTFVDNPERTVVVVPGVNALDGLGQKGNNLTITADIVVIRALTVLGFAAGNQVFHTERAVALGRRAMDDQQ